MGLGERATFRTILRYAADHHPECVIPNIEYIGYYGRFDDLYSLIGTKCEDAMWRYMKGLFTSDLSHMKYDEPCSLLAKWIKTPDASSPRTAELGCLTAKKLGYSVYRFKRLLRQLRRYIDVTEVKMSAKRWGEISYSAVPSRAMKNYRKAFFKHDEERFKEFLNKVETGEEKINASTLFPYDLVEAYWNSRWGWSFRDIHEDRTIEAQWKALPSYVESGTNAIVIADTSGSMEGRPLNSALSLAVYFAERNSGPYHNLFMSFSNQSTIHELKGETLLQKLKSINMNDWGCSTNLKAAFDQILDIAVRNHIPQEEMVKSIIVISDMEIDYCGCRNWTFYDRMRDRYAKEGYEIPNVIFWNVESRHDTFHADKDRKGVQLVSGQSAATFKNLMNSIGLTPVELMMKVLSDERYSFIKVA